MPSIDGVGASWLGFYREDPDSTVHQTGLELGLAGLLAGEPGRALRVRSALPGEDYGEVPVKPVRHGADVTLTIDADLQEICESRLREAVAELRALIAGWRADAEQRRAGSGGGEGPGELDPEERARLEALGYVE
mgnify:CR=1 FL=1